MYDLIVIGGGIVGMSAAFHAARAGARTLLIDRADAGKASLAGAGILDPQSSNIETEDWYRLAIPAVDYYSELIEQLEAAGIKDTGYARSDSLVVAMSSDEDERFEALQKRIQRHQQHFNWPPADQIHMLNAETATQIFPPIGPIRAGMRLEGAARVDASIFVRALQQLAQQRHGLHMRRESVERLRLEDGRLTGVTVSGERISAESYLIAGGAWSPKLAEQLKFQLPIVPQRGQIAHLLLPGVETSDWPIVIALHGHYIVPWPDHRVVVGATREFAGYEPHTTVKGINELLTEALRVAPGLADATIGEVRVGLRPSSPDLLPILGSVPTASNVFLATGHGSTGLQLGPYSGKLVAEMALGRTPDMNLDAYSCTRFG